MNSSALTAHLKSAARRLGFTLTGVCPAVAPTGVSRLADWLDRGYAGQMYYIAARQEAYSHPRHILDGCRSILMLGLPYSSRHTPCAVPPGHGQISSYATGSRDYHDTIHDKLQQLIATLSDLAPHATARGVVDTAPLLEREFAVLAGLGWIGKHTLLIQRPRSRMTREGEAPAQPTQARSASEGSGYHNVNHTEWSSPTDGPDDAELDPISKLHTPKSLALSTSPAHYSGSYFFLAALLTDLELASDEPFAIDHCGTCRACLDACPTSAFPQPYVLDATRCISYLTIELRDHIPRDLRPGIGDWLFGCDVCQDVCPWNQHTQARSASEGTGSKSGGHCNPSSVAESPLGPHKAEAPASLGNSSTLNLEPGTLNSSIDLISLFDLDDAAFRRRFRHTPLWRPRRRGILRNAAIVLGNQFRAATTQARSASEGTGGQTALHSADARSTAVDALIRGLHDPEPLIRAASAWALGQIATPDALEALRQRRTVEADHGVLSDLELISPSPTH